MLHLIRFANEDDYTAAVGVFFAVLDPRVALPNLTMLVTNNHIHALNEHEVSFRDLTHSSGGKPRGD